MPPLAEIFKNRLQKNMSEVALVESTLPLANGWTTSSFQVPFGFTGP